MGNSWKTIGIIALATQIAIASLHAVHAEDVATTATVASAPMYSFGSIHAPLYFVLDAEQKLFEAGQGGVNTLGLLGSLTDSATARRTAKGLQRVKDGISFDITEVARNSLTCADVKPCDAVMLTDAKMQEMKTSAELSSADGILLMRYLPFVSDRLFWARLRIEQVKLNKKGEFDFGDLATVYFVSALSDDEKRSQGEVWKGGSPNRLEQEVLLSLADMPKLLERIKADAGASGNAQRSWASLPAVPKASADWVFRCRGIVGCHGQKLLNLTNERAWISFPTLNNALSLSKTSAAIGSNAMAFFFPD